MERNMVSGEIVDAAIKVHTALGPGLLESAYEACLFTELGRRSLDVARQVSLPVIYEGEQIDLGYRLDLVVEDEVIAEIKTVAALNDIHKAQLNVLSSPQRTSGGLAAELSRSPDGRRRPSSGKQCWNMVPA